MRILLLFIILCKCFGLLFAEQIITKEYNAPRQGDILHKQKIEYIDPDDSGINILWDLRNVVVIDNDYETSYFTTDSLLALKDRKTCYYYKVIGDTLFGCGYNNYQTQMTDSIAPIEMIYPLRYGDKHFKDFHLKGKYHQICNIEAIGKTIIHADGIGTVLLPNNDTISNVIRVLKEHQSFVRINKNEFIYPIDTLTDSSLQHVEKTYQWYSEGYRYPIFETETHIYKQGPKILSRHETAYIFSPQDQLSLTSDETNIPTPKTSPNSLKPTKEYCKSSTLNISTDDISISTNFNTLKIEIIPTILTEYKITLSDVQGRIWRTITNTKQRNTPMQYNIDISDVPSGNYLLTIISNNRTITHKLSLKTQ